MPCTRHERFCCCVLEKEMMRHALAIETLTTGRLCLWHRPHPAQDEHRSRFGSRYSLRLLRAALASQPGVKGSAALVAHIAKFAVLQDNKIRYSLAG